MAPRCSPRLRWPGNWRARRPSVRPVRTMTCLSTSSPPLSRRSTINQMAWGTEVSGSATAACSSRIWTYRCLWTFQTTVNQTSAGRSPWGTCSPAAAASALMFSPGEFGANSSELRWTAMAALKLGFRLTSLVQSSMLWAGLFPFHWSPLVEGRNQMALGTGSTDSRLRSRTYTWATIEFKVVQMC